MATPLLPLLLGLALQAADTPRPSEDALQRARQLLMGTWDFRTIVENGETLGPALIRQKVAADGKLKIGRRMMEIETPEAGDLRVSAYMINPATEPRQFDVINDDDRLLRGIYKFDGNDLVICLQHRAGGDRPTTFDAPAGSNLVLMRLRTTGAALAAEPTPVRVTPPATTPPPSDDLFPPRSADTPKPSVVTASLRSDSTPRILENRQPTEDEVRRAHEMLTGTWQVVGVERSGERIGAELFREKVSKDGRVVVGNRVISMVSPVSGEKRISAFRVNPARSPRQIDLISEFDDVKRGIYQFQGDELWVCFNEQKPDSIRPVEFSAPDGSGNVLMRLRLVENPTPKATPAPAPPPKPSAAEVARRKEEQIRTMLVGSWSYTDSKGQLTLLIQSDGSFTATRKWAKATKRLFAGQTTTSRGRWSYGNGWFRADVLSSEDMLMVGRTYYGRLETVAPGSIVAEDLLGNLMTYRRIE